MIYTIPTTAILAARRRYIRTFQKQKAVTTETAIDPERFNLKKGIIFNNLVKQHVLIPVSDHKFYLDEAKEYKVGKRARTTAIIILGITVLIALVTLAIVYHSPAMLN